MHVHSWAEVECAVLGEGCDIGRHARVRNVIFDKFVTIDPGVRIGFDPEEDLARGLTISPAGIVAAAKGTPNSPQSKPYQSFPWFTGAVTRFVVPSPMV